MRSALSIQPRPTRLEAPGTDPAVQLGSESWANLLAQDLEDELLGRALEVVELLLVKHPDRDDLSREKRGPDHARDRSRQSVRSKARVSCRRHRHSEAILIRTFWVVLLVAFRIFQSPTEKGGTSIAAGAVGRAAADEPKEGEAMLGNPGWPCMW